MSRVSRRIRSSVTVVVLIVASCSGSAQTTSTMGNPTQEVDNEHDRFIVSCLAEFGIAAETLADKYPDADLSDGGVFIPDSYQQESVQTALKQCREDAVAAGLERDFEDPDVLREVYRELIDLYDCLVENDFPATEPPSLEVFVESDGNWHPSTAMGTNIKTIKAAAEACPADGFGVLDLNELGLGEQP